MFAKQVEQSKKQQLHGDLLAVVAQQQQALTRVLYQFQQQAEHSQQDYLALNEKIIRIVDALTRAGDWQSSLYLRNVVKPFLAARERALAVKQSLAEQLTSNDSVIEPQELEQRIYMVLYQDQAFDLALWRLQLKSLHRCSQGRPIYTDKMGIKRYLRGQDPMRLSKQAYVELIIQTKHILDYGQKKQDKHGSELLVLQEKALQGAKFVAFFHQDKRYIIKKDCQLVEANKARLTWQQAGAVE